MSEVLYECRATVIGIEAEPMRFIKKKKQRNRKEKTVKSKHVFTILRLKDLKFHEPQMKGGNEDKEDLSA